MTGKPKWASPILGPTHLESVLERRTTFQNDNGVVDGEDPPAYYTSEYNMGKFFPRGCRGMIERIEIYCKKVLADSITLHWGPHPTRGSVNYDDITALDAWAWRGFDVGRMYNYDSLYIWLYYCDDDVSVAYDTEEPYDGHEGDSPWLTLAATDTRLFIRVIYSGKTPGDVPVSGVVNTINIPSSSSYSKQWNYPLPADHEIELITFLGAGYCDYIEAKVAAKTNSHLTYIRIYCDDDLSMEQQFADLNSRGFTATTPTISLTKYGEDEECIMLIHKRFEFRLQIALAAYNEPTAQTVSLTGYPAWAV